MASPEVVKTIEIRAEAGSVRTEMAKAARSMREVSAELAAIRARGGATAQEQERLAAATGEAQRAMSKAAKDAGRLKQQLDEVRASGKGSKSEIARLESQLDAASSRAKIAASQFDKLRTEIDGAGRKADQAEESFKRIDDAMSALKGVAIVGMLKEAGQALAAAGRESLKFEAVSRSLKIGIGEAMDATHGLVGEFDLMVSANKAVQAGVVTSEAEFGKLTAAATKLALANGQDATQGVNDLTEALAKGSSEVLNNLGIYLKAEEAQQAYADKLGKTTDELTEQEKAQAFAVIGLERAMEAADATGVELDELNTSVVEAAATWDEWSRTLQSWAAEAAGAVINGLSSIGESIGDTVYELTKATETMGSVMQNARLMAHMAQRDAAENAAALEAVTAELTDLGVSLDGIDPRNLEQAQKLLAEVKETWGEQPALGPSVEEWKAAEELEKQRAASARNAARASRQREQAARDEKKEIDALIDGAIKGIAAAAEAREAIDDFWAVYEDEERQAFALKQAQVEEEIALLDMRLGAEEEGSAAYLDLLDQKTAAEMASLELQRQMTDDELALASLETEQKKLQLSNQLAHAKAAAEQERKIQEQRGKAINAVSKSIGEGLGQAAVAALDAAKDEEHAAAKSIAAYAKALRNKMIITAATEAALAVASAASFNAVGAAAHAAAAVQAGAAAALAAGVAGIAGSVAGGGGGGTEASGSALDSQRGTGPGATSDQSQGSSGGGARQLDVPISQDPATRGVRSAPERPLQVMVVLEGPIFAQDKEEVGRWIKGAIAEAEGYGAT